VFSTKGSLDLLVCAGLGGRRITELSGHWTVRLSPQGNPDSFGLAIYCNEQARLQLYSAT